MAKNALKSFIEDQTILSFIYIVRGQKIMLDEDLAKMYRVETRRLNEQVKRNLNRFPADFMFTLTDQEYEHLMSQNATSRKWGGRRKPPIAFTEQGVAMLSSVLNSDVAIQVNIRIIRVFTKLKEFALSNKEILIQLTKLEKEVGNNSQDIVNIFTILRELIEKQNTTSSRNKIGFKQYDG